MTQKAPYGRYNAPWGFLQFGKDGTSIMSEHTKNLQPEELVELRENVEKMDGDALVRFRNSFDPDIMGFDGVEGAVSDEYK